MRLKPPHTTRPHISSTFFWQYHTSFTSLVGSFTQGLYMNNHASNCMQLYDPIYNIGEGLREIEL